MPKNLPVSSIASRIVSLSLGFLTAASVMGQERIATLPGYQSYRQLVQRRDTPFEYGRIEVEWAPDGKRFTALHDGRREQYDVDSGTWSPVHANPRRQTDRMVPARGRQFDSVTSPDGILQAVSRDRNIYIKKAGSEYAVTTDGSASTRVKYGAASWVYGEELDQREAMWFSPDSKKLAFYRFDESKVPDYYLARSQVEVQDRLDVEAYPKAGAPNPISEVQIYDLSTKQTVKLDAHFGDPKMGEYVYNVRWSAKGDQILFFRENRLQNRMQFCAGDAQTGACRTILEESNPNGWVPYMPGSGWTDSGEVPLYLGDDKFIWVSERNGYRNAYLYNLSGRLLNTLTNNAFDLQRLLGVEADGSLWYTAHDGKYPSQVELHKVKLDGSADERLTDPALSHAVQVDPTGKYFVDIAEGLDVLPQTRLCDSKGKVLRILASSDAEKAKELGLKPVERISYVAADGVTRLYGYISKPTHFDAKKRYPLLVSVYGGPDSSGTSEQYQETDALSEFGFVVAWFDGRGTFGRGREFSQAVYRHLGGAEIDDQAAGVKSLAKLPYIDGSRVGIFGTSYGGYASLMALLRYPDIFKSASASSPVTDWRNYDSTYTERYMDTPQRNPAGYSAASALTYAKDKRGSLLLYFGTSDNNVHPSNTVQLISAFDRAGKGYELALGPDEEHSGVNEMRMMEFFIDHLVLER